VLRFVTGSPRTIGSTPWVSVWPSVQNRHPSLFMSKNETAGYCKRVQAERRTKKQYNAGESKLEILVLNLEPHPSSFRHPASDIRDLFLETSPGQLLLITQSPTPPTILPVLFNIMHFIKQRAATTTRHPESHLQLLIPHS